MAHSSPRLLVVRSVPIDSSPRVDLSSIYASSKGRAPCTKYLKEGTETYFYTASRQLTIHPYDGSYEEILNEAGLERLREIEKLVATNSFKDVLDEWFFTRESSGTWTPDPSSPFYASQSSSISTLDDMVVVGRKRSSPDSLPVTTSRILFYTDTWCYTISGSLYGLGVHA